MLINEKQTQNTYKKKVTFFPQIGGVYSKHEQNVKLPWLPWLPSQVSYLSYLSYLIINNILFIIKQLNRRVFSLCVLFCLFFYFVILPYREVDFKKVWRFDLCRQHLQLKMKLVIKLFIRPHRLN